MTGVVHFASAEDGYTRCGKLALLEDGTRLLETDLNEMQVSCKTCLRLMAKRRG